MKTINVPILVLLLGLFVACQKDEIDSNTNNEPKNYSFSGVAQKGPFIIGSNITLNELNSNLGQTGKSFSTVINDNDGSFSLSNIELNSDLVLLTSNGFYFSEIYGELSGATLSLQSITDLAGNESVSINVLTHLTKGRIEKLVADGMSYQAANEQAKSELITFLGVTEPLDIDFDNLDISVNEESNAVLLAFSIILQRYTDIMNERPTLTAELTQLLSNLSSDFEADGLIDNQALIDTLLFNISQLNLIDIRNNVESRYSSLGQAVTIPDFEKYIAKFQEKHNDYIYTNFTYPDSVAMDPGAPDWKISNILIPSDTIFQPLTSYSIAAITPLNSTLKIKVIGSFITLASAPAGWEFIDEYPNGFTLNSQRQNELMSAGVIMDLVGNATIEYYENTTDIPTFTKNISWE